MASKSKSKYHSESKFPSTSPPTSPSHLESLNLEREVDKTIATTTNPNISEKSTIEPPEVESLIHKLQGFSISPRKSEISQGSVTSQYNPSHPLTRLQSEKFGIKPTELPLPKRKRARKSPKGSDRETLSSSSSILTSALQSQPSTPPLQIIVQNTTGTSTSPSQSSRTIISSSSQLQGTSSVLSSISSSMMAQNPWSNPGAVLMPTSLSQLPTHPEKWLPKFNPEAGMLVEGHINKFMLSINLNGVANEDDVVRLFPYTLQGAAGSWYFSLPSKSITSWDIFQEKLLTKFGDDRSTMTLINDLSNLKTETREPIKDFNLRFNKILNKIPTASKPSEEV